LKLGCQLAFSFILEENIFGGKQIEVEENIKTKEGKIYWRKKKKGKNLFGNNFGTWLKKLEDDDKRLGETLDC
jgi:hypothetical protein